MRRWALAGLLLAGALPAAAQSDLTGRTVDLVYEIADLVSRAPLDLRFRIEDHG